MSPSLPNADRYQLTISSLSRLRAVGGRYNFQDGEQAFITVIKRLTDGVWLIGFRGHALRAHSTVTLPRGARLPVSLSVEGDTLLLRLLDTEGGEAAKSRLFSASARASSRHAASLESAQQEAARQSVQFERLLSILIDKGFTRNLPALANLLLQGGRRTRVPSQFSAGRPRRAGAAPAPTKHHPDGNTQTGTEAIGRRQATGDQSASGDRSAENAARGSAGGDQSASGGSAQDKHRRERSPLQSPQPAVDARDRDAHDRDTRDRDALGAIAPDPDGARLLALFNHLVGTDQHWLILPFALKEPAVEGTMRLRVNTVTHDVETAMVVVEHSTATPSPSSRIGDYAPPPHHPGFASWAIAIRSLCRPHPDIVLYASDTATLRHLDDARPKLADRLRRFGIKQVAVEQWDRRFDGFDGFGDAAAPDRSSKPPATVNIHA